MSLTLARLCGEWRQIIQDMNNLLAEQIIQDMNNFSRGKPLKKSESRWRYWKAVEEDFLGFLWKRKAVEESEKPLKKSESHWRRFSWISWKSESRCWRKSNFVWGKSEFRRRKIPIFPRYSWVSGNFGVLFWHQICYHVHAWIYLIGFSVFQLLITLAFQMK